MKAMRRIGEPPHLHLARRRRRASRSDPKGRFPAPGSCAHRRGVAGLAANRRDLCRHLWELWSPSWRFQPTTFDRTAVSFDNPDFVDVVIHSYRHRFANAPGDPAFDELEARLARQPDIAVPTVVLQGRDDGVDPPGENDPARPHFTGPYRRRILDGVGHNLPQEAPDEFAAAILSLL